MTKSIQNPKADRCFRGIQYHLKTLHVSSMAGVIRGTSLCVLEIPKSDMGVSSKMVWAFLHALKPPIWFKTKTKSIQKSFTNQSKIFWGGYICWWTVSPFTRSRLERLLRRDAPTWFKTGASVVRAENQHPLVLSCLCGLQSPPLCSPGLGFAFFIITSPLQQTQQRRVCTCSLCQENSQLDMRHKFNKLLCECWEQMS